MWLIFDKKRCPLCGSFGKRTNYKNIFICPKCLIPFNEFGVSSFLFDKKKFYQEDESYKEEYVFDDFHWCLT